MGELKPHLSLWRQGLGVVPDEVWLRIDLLTLVLADNDLTEISERVGDLSKLRMLDLDLDYIDHGSIGTDLRILWRTLKIVLLGRGAY